MEHFEVRTELEKTASRLADLGGLFDLEEKEQE